MSVTWRATTVALLAGSLSLAGALWGLTAAGGSQPARIAGKGTVQVLYAGSLVDYMEHSLGPAFQSSSGYGFAGFGGGSTELANEIRGGVRQGDVFVSAAAAADSSLEGAAGGKWVSWYSTFAATPLMLGYNPNSSFGRQLAHGTPWYKVITEPGILVGRTDPKLDPKGVLTVEAVVERGSQAPRSAAHGGAQLLPGVPRDGAGRAPAVRPARRRLLLRRGGRFRPLSRRSR